LLTIVDWNIGADLLLTGSTAIDPQENDGGSSSQEAFTCQQQPSPNLKPRTQQRNSGAASGAKPIAQSN
jgi:hypothetical protein